MVKVSSVEEFIEVNSRWTEALTMLRNIISSTEVEETIKWSAPVYTVNGKNVIRNWSF